MYSIMVVEDHLTQRKNLVHILKQINSASNIIEADGIHQALELLKSNCIDLFFLDIELLDGSGLELAEEIRKSKAYEFTWIVFITCYEQYALEAYKGIHCYEYITKPYNEEHIKSLTIKLLDNLPVKKTNNAFMLIDIEGISLKIFFHDIIFIEVYKKDSIIHTVYGQHKIKRMALKNLVHMTEKSELKQVHRAYIVNLNRIKSIDRTKSTWNICFEGYSAVALVGSTYQKTLIENMLNR